MQTSQSVCIGSAQKRVKEGKTPKRKARVRRAGKRGGWEELSENTENTSGNRT